MPVPPKDLLADHHTEADTQGNLPQRNIRRAGQGEQDGCDEETLVHFMPATNGEQYFPADAHQESDNVNRQEKDSAEPETMPQVAGIVAAQQFYEIAVPALDTLPRGHNFVGLEPEVIHAVEHGGKGRHPDSNHDPFEVHPVAHVSGGAGYGVRGIQEGVKHLVQGIPLLETAPILEMVLYTIKHFSQSHALTLLLDSSQVVPQDGAVLVLARTHITAQRQVFLFQFHAAK